MLSQTIEIVVCGEQNVTRKSVVSSELQPLDRFFFPVHECVSTGDVVSRMVEVSESLAALNR